MFQLHHQPSTAVNSSHICLQHAPSKGPWAPTPRPLQPLSRRTICVRARAHTHGWTGGVKHEDMELRKVSTGFLGAPARSSRGRGRSLHKAEKWPPRRAVDLPAASHPLCLHKRPPSDSHRTSSFSAHHPRGWGS